MKLTDEQADVVARIRKKSLRGRAAEAVRLAAGGMPLVEAARQAGVPYVTAVKAWRKEQSQEAAPAARKRRVTREDVDAMVTSVERALDRMLERIEDPALANVLLESLRYSLRSRTAALAARDSKVGG